MNVDKILDIRFTAPVGIMVFFIFLFSPSEFINRAQDLTAISWVVNLIGVLGMGFMISSIVNFISVKCLDYLNPVLELQIWRNLAKERCIGEDVPNQVHKRWNISMANYNVVVGIILAPAIAYILKFPCPSLWYYITLLVFLLLFWFNGQRARKSVEKINCILKTYIYS